MFEDLFDTLQETATGGGSTQVQSAWDRLPRSCADSLPKPDSARQKGYPIGLKNQGATCYLNSLLQILFHTPQLRKTILDLPLCKNTPQQKSQFLNPHKQKFMVGFQRLFAEMSLKDTYSLSTEYLKDAFGWQGTQHIVQHDIEQAMKIIFDTFERALEGTQYEKNIKQLFKGVSSRYKNCRNCTITQQRPQQFYGLNLQVQNFSSLDESLMGLLIAQSMQGANQIYCQTCQSKQDMWLGTKLKVLPTILVFTLTRFTFNYQTFDRVKLTNFFSFKLEENFSHLLDEAGANADVAEYQLYGVLIHRGSAHSGHYLCYIRDTMQESDWSNKLKEIQKKQQENKQKLQQEKDKLLTQEQKSRKQQKNKQQKQFQLSQPNNVSLLQNWFQINDNIVTAIDGKKITTKYQGSQSAYILFYRRRGSPLPTQIKVPQYFSKVIKAQNELLHSEREEYNNKKNQIILKINGNDQVLSVDTKINDLLAIYCEPDYVLVNEAKHNGLPYYPKQLNSLKQYAAEDTVKSMDLIHESVWIKYDVSSQQYLKIQPLVQTSRMPFQVNVFFNENNQKMILYQDQTLSQLKLKIQQKYSIPYQSQIIKLVTAYRQYFVTDDLSNDDALLTKLGFIHQCQVILKKLQKGQNVEEAKKIQQKVDTNTICFVIERDDVHGIKRMYFDKHKTLDELFQFVVESQDLDKDTVRRFRNLNGDRLFYSDQYEKTLEDLQFNQEIVKLRIQRGEVPIKGDICVVAKMQSKFQTESVPSEIQLIFDPNATVLQVKTKICQIANLQPQMHRVYMTDWMGEPVRTVTKQKQSIFDARFGKQEKICIRDIQSPIGAQLMLFQVYQTKLGTPEDVRQPIANLKIQEHKTLKDLKTELLKSNLCKDKGQLKINQLRVRQIKKDYMFGTILRENNKQLKNCNLNNNKIAVQILPEEEQLTQNQIVLVLKKRDKQKRLYEGHQQLIFEAAKAPSIQDLNLAIKNKLQISENEKIRIAKYVHYDFEWLQISEKSIDHFLKLKVKNTDSNNQKKGKQGKKQGKKEGKKQGKKENINKKQQETIREKEKETNSQVQRTEDKVQPQNKQQGTNIQANNKEKKKQKHNKLEKDQKKDTQNKQNSKEGKQKNKGKQKDQNAPQKQGENKRQDCLNLRKAPFLLKDGDWIGFGKKEQLEGDDLQTDEDLTLRLLKKNQKAVSKRNRGPEQAFKVNTGF